MGMLKYTLEEEVKKLEAEIKKLEERDLKGWIARMWRHYEIKKLKQQIKELQKP
jgi:hypothetical protein